MQSIFVFYFSLISYQVLKRKRQRLNIIFSAFFISIIIQSILNMIYGAIKDPKMISIILILNFFTNFFICFGPIFILVVNLIILESTLIFSIKRQNRYILIYGLLLLCGMTPFYIFRHVRVNPAEFTPEFSIYFLIFVISFTACLVVIPFIYTHLKIYRSFETQALKRKWLFFLIGFLGSVSIAYLVMINNLVIDHLIVRDFFSIPVSIYAISVILWGYLMYYGIGAKLKQ